MAQELKVYKMVNEKYCTDCVCVIPAEVYFKSEADKVIAHQKYKRCLAMAKWCFTKSNYHFVLARHGEDAKENNRKHVLYSKWRKRWLELAEKFKECV